MKRNASLLWGIAASALLVPAITLGQSRFLDDQQCGLGLAASREAGEDVATWRGTIVYTFGGRVDLSCGIGTARYDENGYGDDFSATFVSPGISVSVVRPTNSSILGVEVVAAHTHGSYSSATLDVNNLHMTSTGYNAGVEAYLRLASSQTLVVFPAIGVSFARVTSEIEDWYGDLTEVEDTLLTASIGLLINKQMFIVPGYSRFNEVDSWGLSLGVVVPTAP